MTNAQQTIPSWFLWSLYEKGVKETPGAKSTPRIIEYRDIAKIKISGDDSDVAWCAIFRDAALEANGVPSCRSPMARATSRNANFIELQTGVVGCVVEFWRGSKTSGLGHTGFYVGESATHIQVLGGNQGDAISIASFRRDSAKFGLVGFYWPKSIPVFGKGVTGIKEKFGTPVSVT